MCKKLLSSLLVIATLCAFCVVPTTVNAAKKPSLNKSKLSLKVGNTFTLKLKNTKGKIKWSSSKKSVASVSKKGKVTAKKSGKTTVTAKYKGKKYTCKVTVKSAAIIKTKSITLSKKELVLYKGETKKLSCSVLPKNVTSKKLNWITSNSDVAAVDSSGNIKAKKSGECTVTVYTTDGTNLKASCEITVLNKSPDSTIASNLQRIKNHILTKGDVNKNNQPGIFGEDIDDDSETYYSIRYNAEKDMLEFGFYDDYWGDDSSYHIITICKMNLAMTGFDIGRIILRDNDYKNEVFKGCYEVEACFDLATYNTDSAIPSFTVQKDTIGFDHSDIERWSNTGVKLALISWDDLLYQELGMTLNDIGFSNY